MARSPVILLQITLCLTVLVVETYSSISWTREILHRTKRQAECKPDEFKCTSGECIDIVSMCDGTKKCADGSDETEIKCKQLNITDSSGGCLLPQPPEFGAYTSPVCQIGKNKAACRQQPGTPVPQNWLLSFKCNEGYSHKESQDANISVLCVDGKWSPKIPICRMCGKRNTQGVNKPLITYGSSTKYAEFPWHVGLYMRNKSSQWEQACGGTLISPHIVLTAAHCVFSEPIKALLPPEAIKVVLGKYYREWTHDEPYAVQANVSKIVIPPRYYGSSTSYIYDIALLDLTHSVQIDANIMPVCVDWNRELTVTPGTLGTLAGWGVTEHKTTSDVLLHVDLPYIDYNTCLKDVQLVFQRYVTPDKFCAGYRNGTGDAQGDSGGGLTFVHDDLYYVYGIVSTKVREANSFITFTNISNEELFSWFNRAKRTLDEAHNIET